MLIRLRPDPYNCYAISFGMAVAVYLLGWSGLYPPLQLALIAFLFSTVVIHLWLSARLQKSRPIISQSANPPGKNSPVYVTGFIYTLWVVEFVYEGGVPLFKILFDIPYDYKLFGVPSLHVFVVTFSSFYTIYLFQQYLSSNTRLLLMLYLLNLAAAILIYNRGMLFFNLAASLFVYLACKERLSVWHMIMCVLAIPIIFYFFGVFGTLRVSRLAGKPYDNEYFLEGRATNEFRNSILPKEYFWSYIYISSPLANLQLNTTEPQPAPLTIGNLVQLVNSEMLPDFLSKRITKAFRLEAPADKRIPGPFNVSTIYSRSYSYAGWTGVVAMALFLLVFPMIFIRTLPATSRFFLSGWVILCTMYFYSAFDNTFRFTGLSFQLVYPVILHWSDQKWRRLSGVF